ncbi:MAG: hypothetical protein GY849_08970, partial [Deltaproteobacteria bacterium]|nr:hypothetical protein [Deltaproteobacteria bacterium]
IDIIDIGGAPVFPSPEPEIDTGDGEDYSPVDWERLGYSDTDIGDEWGPDGYDEDGFAIDAGGWGNPGFSNDAFGETGTDSNGFAVDAGGWGDPGFASTPTGEDVTADLASMGIATTATGDESLAGLQPTDFTGLDSIDIGSADADGGIAGMNEADFASLGMGADIDGGVAGMNESDFAGLDAMGLSPSGGGDGIDGLSGYSSEAGYDPGAGLGVSADVAAPDADGSSPDLASLGLSLLTGGPNAVVGEMLGDAVANDVGLYSPTSAAGKAGASATNVFSTALLSTLFPPASVLGPTIGKGITHTVSDLFNARPNEGWRDYAEDNTDGLIAGIKAGNAFAEVANQGDVINADLESLDDVAQDNEAAEAYDNVGNIAGDAMLSVGGGSLDTGTADSDGGIAGMNESDFAGLDTMGLTGLSEADLAGLAAMDMDAGGGGADSDGG